MLESKLLSYGAVEVTAYSVYQDIFRLGTGVIQRKGELAGEYKANPVAYFRNSDDSHGSFRIMFEDTFEDDLKKLQDADFAILNGLTFFGRKNTAEHASKMYAMIFDLDGVTDETLGNFLYSSIQSDEIYPLPNYIVLSGHGVHLYYVFETPISLYPGLKLQLKNLKYGLTERIWNGYTSVEKKVQRQGICQPFRVIGGKTKVGAPIKIVTAYKLREKKYTLQELNRYVPDHVKVDEKRIYKETKYTIEEASKKFPEWYQKVVVGRKTGFANVKKWDISGKVHGKDPWALYHWWIDEIKKGATYGHRYFCVLALVIYGVKCDVPEEKVKADALELVPFLNQLREEEPFTEKDVLSALECYDRRYCTFPLHDIEKLTCITIERNKRNGRKQNLHLNLARGIREIKGKIGENVSGGGRPEKKKIVSDWRQQHPEGRKIDCERETGLSRHTVLKWWQAE